MNHETELKLDVGVDGLTTLCHHPLTQSLQLGPPCTRQQRSVYYDTPDFALRDIGLVLRVRHVDGRHVLGVKTAPAGSGGFLHRGEWEAPLPGPTPSLDTLPDAAIRDRLRPYLAQIRPVFTTDIERTTIQLGGADWAVEMALDHGEIVADSARAPVAELELELRRGAPRHLFDLAQGLQHDLPARLMVRTKSDRGFALAAADDRPPAAVKAPPTTMPPEASVIQAVQCVARNCLDHLLANQPALAQSHDPEAVHQMRVALRRLRTALRLFRPVVASPETDALEAELRWLLSFLGPARDLDVFIQGTLDPAAQAVGDDVATLRASFAARHQHAVAEALGALASPRFTALALRLGGWIEGGDWTTPVDAPRAAIGQTKAVDHLPKVLDKLARKMLTTEAALSDLSDEQRHRIRIKAKRLRYAGEFFACLFPAKPTRKYTAAMAELQDRLGTLNDMAVARRLLHAPTPAEAWAGGLVVGWHTHRGAKALEAAETVWRRVPKLAPFWD